VQAWSTLIKSGQAGLAGLFRAYAAIFFAEKPWAGGMFLVATMWFPNAGLSGLLAALAGMITARLLQFHNLKSGLHVYNSLLVGLSLGAYYQLDMYLAVLIIMGAIMAVLATVALMDLLWRLGHLPALSLPFVIVALITSMAAHSYGTLSRYLVPLAPHDIWLHPWLDQFLTALGSAFFIPHPLPGLLMFCCVLLTSRYLALLAIYGFASGYATYVFLSGSPHPDLVAWNGFNFILVSMAVGGIFTVPSRQSFLLAGIGAMLAALLTSATETFMLVYGLPVMALPFLMVTMLLLLALQRRPASKGLQILVQEPALPERSFERNRLAIARNGEFGSVPVLPPFLGYWNIYQGFNGAHTHQPPWQHALDFYIAEEGRSCRSDGVQQGDYYCFGLPVVAPVEGYVVKALDSLPDNRPGQVDTENNWGNHVLIRMHNGLYLLLAHLKQESLAVKMDDYVRPGQKIALCGSSGRAPQPHLHMHVQIALELGSPTHPFHLTTVLLTQLSGQKFSLFARPGEGDGVLAPNVDQPLAASMQLLVGKQLVYRVSCAGKISEHALVIQLSLNGEMRICSNLGASAAIFRHHHLLAFHDRKGPEDAFFDAWLLALGLTPFCEGESGWHDEPSRRLFPLSRVRRWLLDSLLPMAEGIHSDYSRKWRGSSWLQQGNHSLNLLFSGQQKAQTEALFMPHLGCTELHLRSEHLMLDAKLIRLRQQADAGVPEWEMKVEDIKGEE